MYRRFHAARVAFMLVLLVIGACGVSGATENGLGRTIEGIWGGPGSGIIPPVAGLYTQNFLIYYNANASARREFPLFGDLVLGARIQLAVDYYTLLHVPQSQKNGRSFGYGISVPVQYTNTTAQVVFANRTPGRSDTSFNLADVFLIPFAFGWQDQTQFTAFKLLVNAPTGFYTRGNLSSNSMNCWVFMPMLGLTKLDPKHGWDYSSLIGVDIYTRNAATHYLNGSVLHIDASATKAISDKWGAGAMLGWLQQLNKDRGGLANVLDGFEGQAVDVGPIVTYSYGTGLKQVNMNLRWLTEVSTRRRFKGNVAQWNAMFRF